MAKSRNAQMAAERRKREAARLETFGGDRVAASIASHRERLARAVMRKDYETMRDSQKALADLGARG